MIPFLPLATRLLPGISVPDTPLITGSIALAQDKLPESLFNHVMRSRLIGQASINRLPAANRSVVDEEAHGVAAILHDLGFAFNTTIISPDRLFELVWDAIALHTQADITKFKEPLVAYTSSGTLAEIVGQDIANYQFGGPVINVSKTEWDAIYEAYPKKKFRTQFFDTVSYLCKTKPATTYNNFLVGVGDRFTPGYNKTRKLTVDLLDALLTDE
ncbi:hypothetical protein BDV95DRAFT_649144 [Massariosphaeria phaeospora]|uniref:HD domain-containing protein n=1 Tax=Massariosphaeria phaeospora TaxID=100035 RepID=A0A7C8I3U7_9PLEO|nr:hypothetical protein BDV95DRAFT_649144 [Massariosphaeria phaeospora]